MQLKTNISLQIIESQNCQKYFFDIITTMSKASIQVSQQEISQVPLSQFFELAKAGIINLKPQTALSFPVSATVLYLYLKSNQQNLPLIKDLLSLQHLVIRPSNQNHLADEILQLMLQNDIQLAERCIVDQHRQGLIYIDSKNTYALKNLIRICLLRLKNKCNSSKRFEIVRDYILPLYIDFGHSSLNAFNSDIMDSISTALTIQNGRFKQQLTHLFVKNYQQYWSKNKNQENIVPAIQSHFALLELIFSQQPYTSTLISQSPLKPHLKMLLTWKGQGTGHRMAPKIYQHFAKSINQFNNSATLFLSLFGALQCYGAHLARDAWPTFYNLLQQGQSSVFSLTELAQILLIRVQKHENVNVIKNCVSQLIKNEKSNQVFQKTPLLVYNSIVRLLGNSSNFLDCFFHMDAKTYEPISSFFLKYLNQQIPAQVYQDHLTLLFDAILRRQSWDHALIALIIVFKGLNKKSSFVKQEQLSGIQTLLLKAYPKLPIRKRFQLMDSIFCLIRNHMDVKNISLSKLSSLLIHVEKEYLIGPNLNKIKLCINLYSAEQVESWGSQVLNGITEMIEQRDSNKYSQILDQIILVERVIKFSEIDLESYFYLLNNMLADYGQSQYKTLQQRQFMLKVYDLSKQSIALWLRQQLISKHLQDACNNIALYCSLQNNENIKQINSIVKFIFKKAYEPSTSAQNNQPKRLVVARMFQWAYDKLYNCQLQPEILIQAFKARVQILRAKRSHVKQYAGYSNWFEQTVYVFHQQIKNSNSQIFRSLPPGKRLRLTILISTILTNDTQIKNVQLDQIADVIDCYDFQHYEQLCWWIQAIYIKLSQKSDIEARQRMSEEQSVKVVKLLDLITDNMLHSLEYSLGKKEIVALTQCACCLFFTLSQFNLSFSPSLGQFILRLFTIGQNNFIFQRSLSLAIGHYFSQNIQKISNSDYTHFIPILIEALSVQEYRGFDSAIYLFDQNQQKQFYRTYQHDWQNNYYGSALRFSLLHSLQSIINEQSGRDKNVVSFLLRLQQTALEICLTPVLKQKMYLSGKNKSRLKMWQLLLVFPPCFFVQNFGIQKTQQVIIKCIQGLNMGSISQIRIYSDLFLLRLILLSQNDHLITADVLKSLHQGLSNSSANNINKSVSFMVISGILFQHLFSNSLNKQLREPMQKLFNCMLTYVASSIAYLRGLSQYFCLGKVGFLENKYVVLLRQSYLNDQDSIRLSQNLTKILQKYLSYIRNWDIYKNLLNQLAINNGNVAVGQHYLQSLKNVGTQMGQQNKASDGYTAYCNIWRKNMTEILPKFTVQDDQEDKILSNQEQNIQETALQRKIDPKANNQSLSRIKILVASCKSDVLIGHLSRTGQIFALQQLIIPTIKIIESDQFKSISVTSQKWLNIRGLDQDKISFKFSLTKQLISHKNRGYNLLVLQKSTKKIKQRKLQEMPRKLMIIIDELNILGETALQLIDGQVQVGDHLSVHVQASVLIWSYFKNHLAHD